MAEIIHPFYDRIAVQWRPPCAIASTLPKRCCASARISSDIDGIRQEVMDEFEIVLTQMPYVGGAASRMSDFFMRLMGFMAISRVLRRHGVPLSVIGEIERETYKAQLLTVPEAERLASGRQFMSSENQTLLREQAAKATKAIRKSFRKISSTISSSRARVTTLNSASTTKLAAFANSRLAMAIRKSCRTFVGLISTPMQREASAWKGHKRWLAARATAISASRGSHLTGRPKVNPRTAAPCRRA